VALSGIWELPVGRGRPLLDKAGGVVNHLLGGWSIQAMWTLQSGPPLNFGNILFYGDVTRIALPRSSRALSQWFNTGAGFERDSRYQLDRNVRAFPLRLTGPRSDGYNSWDLSLFKNIRIGEKLTLQLRAEGQDALNNAMFAAPNTVPTNALFGQVTNTVWSEQRRITVGTRLSW
jgi:hypothetical protein